MIEPDELLLTQEFDPQPEYDLHDTAAGQIRLPCADRSPIEAGFVLTWQERPPRGRGQVYQRTGMVVSCAPPKCSVWVQPDDPRPGEGPAVVVRNVTSDDCSRAERRVGVGRDWMSTEGWQRPRMLPRAVIRTDRSIDGKFVGRWLHADGRCPSPPPFVFGAGVVRGRPRQVKTCYVFRGRYLHPASVRPEYGSGRRRSVVKVCLACLKDKLPTKD